MTAEVKSKDWAKAKAHWKHTHNNVALRSYAYGVIKEHVAGMKALGDPRAETLVGYVQDAIRESMLNDVIRLADTMPSGGPVRCPHCGGDV